MSSAIVAPVFVLLVFGLIEFGRMGMVQQFITNASREGARVAVLDGATSAAVTIAVTGDLGGAGTQETTVAIDPTNPNDAGYGAPVTVTVTVPFSQVSGLPTPIFLGGNTLTAKSVMRRETVP